jgi:cellobiose phosphorylase
MCGTEHLLGVRGDFAGLRIDPCIPKNWRGFKIKRLFRGCIYEIEVKNPRRVSRGIKKILVDHLPIEGNLIPAFSDGKTHKVKVVMG